MSTSLPLQLAETIQTASLNPHPDINHDLNPSTSASRKEPVTISPSNKSSSSSASIPSSHEAFDDITSIDDREEEDGDGGDGYREEEEIPYETIRPLQRMTNLPPLPDLRFEQSYLASIADAEGWFQVGYITVKDQVLLPLLQGTIYALAWSGWRYWVRNTELHGGSVGARVRRWWWRTNNWPIEVKRKGGLASGRYAEQVGDFYKNKLGAGGD